MPAPPQPRLAAFKVPSRIIVWGERLPKGDTGKILKRRIKEIAAKQAEGEGGARSRL